MKKIFSFLLLCCVIIFTITLISPVQAATLKSQYEFKGNFNDSFGAGDPLVVSNAATSGFNTDGWYWTADSDPGTELALTTPLVNPANYSIGIRFKYTDMDGYRKIISFLSSSDDRGLYFYSNNLAQYDIATGVSTFSTDTFYDLVLTRDSADNSVIIYMVDNGVVTNEIDITDTGLETVPNIVGGKAQFLLFSDDTHTNTEWTTGGTVTTIKAWDGPLTPSEIQNALAPQSPASSVSVPIMTEWGMLIFLTISGLGSILYLKRQRASF